MIKVIMFDLGWTLVDGDTLHPFSHVAEALTEINNLSAKDGTRIQSCLVSDWGPEGPPAPAEQIAAAMTECRDILRNAGLEPLFEPVEKRVTLSIQIGKRKPHREIFELALKRLGVGARLDECLLVTEAPDHIAAARTRLGMAALQFRKPGSPPAEFEDWSLAPALIAKIIAK